MKRGIIVLIFTLMFAWLGAASSQWIFGEPITQEQRGDVVFFTLIWACLGSVAGCGFLYVSEDK